MDRKPDVAVMTSDTQNRPTKMWYWQSDLRTLPSNKASWTKYPAKVSSSIERAYQQNKSSVKITIKKRQYEVVFSKSGQGYQCRSDATHRQRPVIRKQELLRIIEEGDEDDQEEDDDDEEEEEDDDEQDDEEEDDGEEDQEEDDDDEEEEEPNFRWLMLKQPDKQDNEEEEEDDEELEEPLHLHFNLAKEKKRKMFGEADQLDQYCQHLREIKERMFNSWSEIDELIDISDKTRKKFLGDPSSISEATLTKITNFLKDYGQLEPEASSPKKAMKAENKKTSPKPSYSQIVNNNNDNNNNISNKNKIINNNNNNNDKDKNGNNKDIQNKQIVPAFELDKDYDKIDIKHIVVKQLFGMGGCAHVHRAILVDHNGKQEMEVAVKKIMKSHEEMMNHELNIFRKLKHPRLLNLIGFAENPEEATFYLITDFCNGGNLSTMIHDVSVRARITNEIKIRLACEIAEGLQELHAKGITHRDLKPQNILLTARDPSLAHAVICDFGVAHDGEKSGKTGISAVDGTYLYMSPEQIHPGKRAGRKSDVWSFGTVLYELFTYNKPFKGDIEKAKYDLLEGNPPGNGTAITHKTISNIVMSYCWEIDPLKRPNISEILLQLQSLQTESEQDQANIDFIFAYVQRRVVTSETIYRFSGHRTGILSENRRMTQMVKDLKDDIKEVWTKKQRHIIRNIIESERFVKGIPSMSDLEHEGMHGGINNCIYLWRNKIDGMGYIGQTGKARAVRDENHMQRTGTLFDKVLNQDKSNKFQNWEVITLCQFKNQEQLNRLEPLHIIVFNTSAQRAQPMGYNNDAGGTWGIKVQ